MGIQVTRGLAQLPRLQRKCHHPVPLSPRSTWVMGTLTPARGYQLSVSVRCTKIVRERRGRHWKENPQTRELGSWRQNTALQHVWVYLTPPSPPPHLPPPLDTHTSQPNQGIPVPPPINRDWGGIRRSSEHWFALIFKPAISFLDWSSWGLRGEASHGGEGHTISESRADERSNHASLCLGFNPGPSPTKSVTTYLTYLLPPIYLYDGCFSSICSILLRVKWESIRRGLLLSTNNKCSVHLNSISSQVWSPQLWICITVLYF